MTTLVWLWYTLKSINEVEPGVSPYCKFNNITNDCSALLRRLNLKRHQNTVIQAQLWTTLASCIWLTPGRGMTVLWFSLGWMDTRLGPSFNPKWDHSSTSYLVRFPANENLPLLHQEMCLAAGQDPRWLVIYAVEKCVSWEALIPLGELWSHTCTRTSYNGQRSELSDKSRESLFPWNEQWSRGL